MNNAGKPLVLAVDDDHDSRLLIERFLRVGAYEVITADSGRAALEILRTREPALILLDITMPEMDGYELCARLQESPSTAYVPVVFVTALDEAQDKAKAFAVGGAGYLVKPVVKETLLRTVGDHLETRSHWYRVESATDLWDEAPLPQKFTQFRESLVKRLDLAPAVVAALAQVRSADVYQFAELLNLSQEELAQQMAAFFGVEYTRQVDADSIQLGVLPTTFCRANHVVALKDDAGKEAFVISNPFSWGLDELDVLSNVTRGRPRRLLITHQQGLNSLFAEGAARGAHRSAPAAAAVDIVEEKHIPFETLIQDAHRTSAVEIVNGLIADAVRRGASDLHIQPGKQVVRVRYRVDGEMRAVMPLESAQLQAVVARLKVMCGMDISENRKPQDGQCMVRVDGQEVELRASTLPSTHGEKVVLRVLGQRSGFHKLENLGFEPDMLKNFRRLLSARQGMILITGPTGSGKTTVLYAALGHLNTEEVNIVTVEDPVEIDLDGVTQVQVHDRAGRTFATTLRAMLRQDPDIVMLGEIRDVETAEIASRAALTGHLVLSTVHTQNTLGTLVRLFDMGVAPYLAASALNAVLAQRLVHRVCEACSEPYDPPAALKQALVARFGSVAGADFRKGRGCNRCHRTGTRGRVGVYELLVIDDDLRHLMTEGAAPSALRDYVARRGFRTLEEDAFLKARRGLISPEEIVKLGFGLAMAMEDAEPEGVAQPAAIPPELALHPTAA